MSSYNQNADVVSDVTLANETLSAIFVQLPPPTLARVTQVSQRFNAVAERILYSSTFVGDYLTAASPIPWRTIRWCNSMQQRSHLLDTTKTLHIRWQSVDSHSPPSPHLIPASLQLAHTLSTLVSLESLELFLGPTNFISIPLEQVHAVERVIRACHFPHLRYCALGAEWAKGVQTYTAILSSFLTAHQTLHHLKLSDPNPALNVPTWALPNLTSFRGSADTAAHLLPGRPVQYLSLVGQDSDVNRENLPRMTDTTIPLRHLDLSAMSIRLILLRNVSTYFPTVETLKIKLALRHTLHYAMSGIRLLAGLSSVLSSFHQLSCLDLSPTEVHYGHGGADAGQELSLCDEWSRGCPSLRRVIFPSKAEWAYDAADHVWVLAV